VGQMRYFMFAKGKQRFESKEVEGV